MDRAKIKEIFLEHSGLSGEEWAELQEYMYATAEALLRAAALESNQDTLPVRNVVTHAGYASANIEAAKIPEVAKQFQDAEMHIPFQKIVEENDYAYSTGQGIGNVTLTEDDLKPLQGLPVGQEPKYTVNGTHIVNRASGEAIPHDEPVFILRARDYEALPTLHRYLSRITLRNAETSYIDFTDHHKAVVMRIGEFKQFAEAHPERMKNPDTVLVNTCE